MSFTFSKQRVATSHCRTEAALEHVDRLIAACGGGRVMVIGTDVSSTVRAFRRRGVDAAEGTLDALGIPGTVDLVVLVHALDTMAETERTAAIDTLRKLAPRALVVHSHGCRHEWERRFLAREWRKHPLAQTLVSFNELDQEGAVAQLLLQPLPAPARLGRQLRELARNRDTRMDMLREAGADADAHAGRYAWATQFVRPGDRVLDAACGLGYGSAILADATLADSVVGVDIDEDAVRYATDHYARDRRRLNFETRDLSTVSDWSRASFDVIVSFETLEHLTAPAKFLAECQRLLTPGGRLICSVPNECAEDDCADSRPQHVHIFTRALLEQLCGKFLAIEQVCGQTFGGRPGTPAERSIRPARGEDTAAESWLLVGMTDPFASRSIEFRHGLLSSYVTDPTNLLAFERDYERPWLLRGMVAIGLRTESPALLERLAQRTIVATPAHSADRGAALCVKAYLHLGRSQGVEADLLQQIQDYCATPAVNPHAHRWHVSLRYVEGLARLDRGERDLAVRALEQCAACDPLEYNPLLATKTVAAYWLLGWMALQSGDLNRARAQWTAGITAAERAMHRPWEEMLVTWSSPVLFGLREAVHIVDLASQCASGLHLLPHAIDRPGVVAAHLAESMARQIEHQTRAARRLEDDDQPVLDAGTADPPRAMTTAPSRPKQRATAMLDDTAPAVAADLRVAIFGAGSRGVRTLAQLRRKGATVDCFVDNNATKWYENIGGVPVVAPAALRARRIDVIAVASIPGRDAIFSQLERLGYQAGHDFDAVAY
ncbi:MAG: methyltransferase domain-containing protein [Vicinamibacterales bacterium]